MVGEHRTENETPDGLRVNAWANPAERPSATRWVLGDDLLYWFFSTCWFVCGTVGLFLKLAAYCLLTESVSSLQLESTKSLVVYKALRVSQSLIK